MIRTPEFSEITGHSDTHLTGWAGQRVHRATVDDLDELRAAALQAGFHLGIASAWRSFERQLSIWNDKACGRRPILDETGRPLARQELDDEAAMWSILRWSALPGASRHHWGTEIDVFETGGVSDGYKLQLTVEETLHDGVFGRFYQWLEIYLSRNDCPFFRPYSAAGQGVAPEPWHLSHAPVAAVCQRALQKEPLRALIESNEIELKSSILDNFEDIFSRYVWVDWVRYPATYGMG